jgi:DNA-binding SARP family transcriptional activator
LFSVKEFPMHRLILLGGIHLESPPGSSPRRSVQPRPLALLVILERSSPVPVTREKAARLLWPDVPMKRARRRLSDLVYILRRELGEGAIRSVADRLQLDRALVGSDAADFERALREEGPEAAARHYGGPFLEGFVLRMNRPFDAWLQGERRALSTLYRGALEEAATNRETREDWTGAVRWWRERAAQDPADSRVVMRLMTALARSGNVPGAVAEARAHEAVLRGELDLPLPAEVQALALELRAPSAPL